MSIADKLLQVNQVKQDIKAAIETKGIPMTNVAFTEYANKILDISGGGGEGSSLEFTDDLEKAISVKEVFELSDSVDNLNDVWKDYKRTPELKYDLALTKVAENQDLAGNRVDIYIGNTDLTTLYNDCVNGTVNDDDLYIIRNSLSEASENVDVAFRCYGDISSFMSVPFPVYSFGLQNFTGMSFGQMLLVFAVADLTPLEMGLGISLIKFHTTFLIADSIKIYSKYDNYKQGLIADLSEITMYPAIEYNMPLYIDDTIDVIEDGAFNGWIYNNYPLVIPNSVVTIGNQYDDVDMVGAFSYWSKNNKQITFGSNLKHIGALTFAYWTSNNQPLVIPNSVESIGVRAFINWTSNTHPLIIPNGVESIGDFAFYGWQQVPYVIMESETPPTLENFTAFSDQNDAPIYVPDSAVDTYKNATNWSALASRIFSINDK